MVNVLSTYKSFFFFFLPSDYLCFLISVFQMNTLKSYTDDISKLGSAEQFILQLIELPDYSMRVEGMLLKVS